MKKVNIKKAAIIGMCCTIISTSTVFAVSDNFNVHDNIKVQINNEWVKEGIEPVIENDRVMVPLNKFMEKLGAKVKSDLKTGMIEVSYGDVTIQLTPGKSSAKIIKNEGGSLKEEDVNLEISPRVYGEKVFVPLRFAAEAMGFDVQWDNSLRAVIIKTEGDVIAVEKPVEFETVAKKAIESNKLLVDLYNKNHMNKGIYSLMDDNYIYVLVSAGEKPTGGYSMEIDSITEVAPRTAYIHAVLSSPSAESYVTQALTYPCAMVKFSKGDIQNIQWDLSGDIQPDENENNEVIKFIQGFGQQLKMVSLTAPEDVLKSTMEKYFGDYVSAGLMEKWLSDPANAPGRLTSSPWPGRIDVLSTEKTAENEYVVKGTIVEFTSVEMEDGGFAAKKAITLKVEKINGKWIITGVELGEGTAENSVVYKNEKYGFNFELPESWNGYSIKNDVWEGISLGDGSKSAAGPVIYIRHPQWTSDNPRQDIPVMIFTAKQWDSLQNDEFGVGAAPMAPSMLGKNSDYVFALPARYNYAFLTGYEEVEEILESNPLKAFEIK